MLSENSQINEFLKCLGYCEGEKVFIRTIPIDKNDKEKTPKNITLTYPINNLPKQESGYGVYFVVNGQGNSKKNIKTAKALFCEFDNLSYNEKNESTESRYESTNESKMSQDMSQDMSQEKPENANKINSFQNTYESTQEKVSQEKNEVEFMEAINFIDHFLETKKGLVNKEGKRGYIKAFIQRDYKNLYDLSDLEIVKLYNHCFNNESNDLPTQQKPDFKIGDKVRSCGNAIYEIVKVNENDSVEGKCLEYSEFPEFIGQTLNIKNKEIKEIVESSNKDEKQCLSLFHYSVGEKVYVLDNGKGNWLSATVEQNYGYGVKVKLDAFRFLMIANSKSICRKIS